MKKITAVEWLVETLAEKEILYSHDIEKAKQMMKEQIIEARNHGIEYTLNGYSMRSEQYYNETYKNTEE